MNSYIRNRKIHFPRKQITEFNNQYWKSQIQKVQKATIHRLTWNRKTLHEGNSRWKRDSCAGSDPQKPIKGNDKIRGINQNQDQHNEITWDFETMLTEREEGMRNHMSDDANGGVGAEAEATTSSVWVWVFGAVSCYARIWGLFSCVGENRVKNLWEKKRGRWKCIDLVGGQNFSGWLILLLAAIKNNCHHIISY